MKIAIDLGNRNTKLACKTGDKIKRDIFQARFTNEEQQDYTAAEVVEIDGIKYCIEQEIMILSLIKLKRIIYHYC